jgi:hypothetical protein
VSERFPGEFDDLAQRLTDGCATEEERLRFAVLLRSDESFRARYAELMRVHALLVCRHKTCMRVAQPLAGLTGEQAAGRAARHHAVGRIVFGSADTLQKVRKVAAAAVAALAVGAGYFAVSRAPSPAARPHSALPPVSVLRRCGADGLELPSALPGTLRLLGGMAQVSLPSGVELILAGPLELALESADGREARLARGSLIAWVPPRAQGLILRTAEIEAWDIGTLFSVSAEGTQGSRVFVFKGAVQVNDPDGCGVALCEGGEGVLARSGDPVVKIDSDWPEAERLMSGVAERGVLRDPASAFHAAEAISALWAEQWLPKVSRKQEQREDRKMRSVTKTGVAAAAAALMGAGTGSQAASLLLYEGFETGTGRYTADAFLFGQSYSGFGEVLGSWDADAANEASATVRATGLKHVVASKGGRLTYTATTGGGVILDPDVSPQGPFATAALFDTVSGKIGGGTVEGVMYASFLFRAATAAEAWNWCGLQTYRDNVELQALGGIPSLSTARYGIFSPSGKQQLRNRGGTGDTLTPDTATRLFVAKITFHAHAADDLTVWMDPDPAKGDNQDASVYMYTGTAVGDLSFDEIRIRGGGSKTWEYDEIRIGTDWASVAPPETQALAYDGFLTGAGGYAADAFLSGQAMLGSGHAAGNWSGSSPTNSFVQAAGLYYKGLYRDGGKVMQRGLGSKGDSAKLDTTTESPANMAGLVHTDGVTIGGGNVSGPLFVSFLLRFHNPGNVEPGRWGGFGIYRVNTEVQALGGKYYGAHGYSLFSGTGGTGNVDLRNATSYVTVDTSTRLLVAKITFNPGTNDHLAVWLDPDPAKGENQDNRVATYSTNYVGNLAFDNYALRAGSIGAVAAVDFDEIRFGRTWQSVLPPPKPGTFLSLR